MEYRIFPERIDLSLFDWTAVSGTTDVALLLINMVLLLTVFFGFRSVRETQQARSAQILIWAIEQMEEIKPDIERLQRADTDFRNWDEAECASANRVSNRFQRLAYMARRGLIRERYFLEMWGLSFVDVWTRLEAWTRYKRRQNDEPETVEKGAFSRRDFELFSKVAKKKFQHLRF